MLLLAGLLFLILTSCPEASAQTVHVFVALADNLHQGIVPVTAVLGNGDDPDRNLYWGAAFGVKSFFKKSEEWQQVQLTKNPNRYVLESVTFRHKSSGVTLIADAYRGSEIKQAIADFLAAASGVRYATFARGEAGDLKDQRAAVHTLADVTVYVGHDGLMDFSMDRAFPGQGKEKRQAIVLACASKQYFNAPLKPTGAEPLLWTTNLMAPEAYTLKAALDGWIAGETDEQIRQRAAAAYAQYQKISMFAALKLFATGW
jgi:hypothetical protein